MDVRVKGKTIAAAILILAALYFLLAYGLYSSLTSRVAGANDFYSRWFGARALFLKGQDPYSKEVTQGIQKGMLGRLARPDEDQLAFAYPLYAAFLALPLVALPYAQAQALWMAALVLAVIGSVLVAFQSFRAAMTPRLFAILLLGTLAFYPSTRAILLGQYAIASFLFLAFAFWAARARQDVLAGILLALATVKPQTAVLMVICMVGWAAIQKRWRLVGSAIVTVMALAILAVFWLPTWPIEFMQGMLSYSGYIRVGAPVQTALALIFPSEWAGPAAVILGLALVAAAGFEWLRAGDDITSAFCFTAFVTVCVAIRIGSSDQVLLLFPWSLWLLNAWRSGHSSNALLMGLGLILVPWIVFFLTLRGDYEDPVVTLVLPAITLLSYMAVRLGKVNWYSQRGAA